MADGGCGPRRMKGESHGVRRGLRRLLCGVVAVAVRSVAVVTEPRTSAASERAEEPRRGRRGLFPHVFASEGASASERLSVAKVGVRGTGFEPADLYRTAPSTLRRWPSLATHARLTVTFGGIKALSSLSERVIHPLTVGISGRYGVTERTTKLYPIAISCVGESGVVK